MHEGVAREAYSGVGDIDFSGNLSHDAGRASCPRFAAEASTIALSMLLVVRSKGIHPSVAYEVIVARRHPIIDEAPRMHAVNAVIPVGTPRGVHDFVGNSGELCAPIWAGEDDCSPPHCTGYGGNPPRSVHINPMQNHRNDDSKPPVSFRDVPILRFNSASSKNGLSKPYYYLPSMDASTLDSVPFAC